ncbi:MAG: M23 family metallopeptidase [Longimicrobiales bacterium]
MAGGTTRARTRPAPTEPVAHATTPFPIPVAPPKTDSAPAAAPSKAAPGKAAASKAAASKAAPRKSTLPPRNAYRRSAQVQAALAELRDRALTLPMAFLTAADLKDSFEHVRGGGSRRHYAIDIPAPLGTPILAIDDGVVVDLKSGGIGGIALVASDTAGRFIYYYAHLLEYHPGMEPGRALTRGDTIGFVGTSGNAPENMPHLHLAIVRASSLVRWSNGTPINPVEIWKR